MAEQIVRQLVDGEWVTAVEDAGGGGGGGGSLPDPITEPLTITPDSPTDTALTILATSTIDDGEALLKVSGAEVAMLELDSDGNGMIGPSNAILTHRTAEGNPKLGFFATTPAAQPTGVAVTAEAIHAALVQLGLITA